MIIDICTSPVLYPYYKSDNDLVIVVDVFRATTTICTAFANGAITIRTVGDIEIAKEYKRKGFLVGAERNTTRCDFGDFGNSPFDYTEERVSGKELVFTTTNGTQAIEMAKDCRELIIGAFSNIDVVADECLRLNQRIVVLCAGWNNKINIEDTLFGGALAEKLQQRTTIEIGSDFVRIAMQLWQSAKHNPMEYIKEYDHYKRLVANGLEDAAPYCFIENSAPILAVYDKSDGKLKRRK